MNRIYAIADLHLSLGTDKPMDIFGTAWENHTEKIARNWDRTVSDSDLVLVAGDISWAMKLPDALPDLQYLAERPGRKILIRGNHDYWWKRENTRRIQETIDPSITLLQGQTLVFRELVPETTPAYPEMGPETGHVGITGTRGWRLDEEETSPDNNLKIYQRELAYLRSGLEGLPQDLSLKIAMLHYPPFDENMKPNEFFELLMEHSVDILVYGHIHQDSRTWPEGDVQGIQCHLVAVDHINFMPKLIKGTEPFL